jgi:hypothetical protein
VQARDGYQWLTTFDSLVRFDGVRFTGFNKSNSRALPAISMSTCLKIALTICGRGWKPVRW